MRRKDREMTREFALAVTDKCEWGILGMVDTVGNPYVVCLNFCRKDNILYFHCAKNGRKTEILKNNPKVCLSFVCDARVIPEKFTTEYSSAYIEGIASEVTDDDEKIAALMLLCKRFSPINIISFENELKKDFSRTAVWKINITEITGKSNKNKEINIG